MGEKTMRLIEGVIFDPMPGLLRRVWCEATGGHRIWVGEASTKDGVFGYRVHCSRCGPLTRWRNAHPAPSSTET